jgi:perosamine synthetase
MNIPLAKPYIDDKELKAVEEVLVSGRWSLGPKLREFEDKFKETIGTKYSVSVSSGTAGLHLCMECLNLNEGDEVITTPFSFVASSNPILFVHGKPIFVDIDEKTYNIDPEKIQDAITSKTKAILPVHIFGQPCDMDNIMKISEDNKLLVVEDASEAIKAELNGRKVGTFGISAVFSFYPNKQMATAEGGIIVTNDERTFKLCKSLSNQGRPEGDFWLAHERLGYNYRFNDILAAIGLAQLEKLDGFIETREKIAKEYTKRLEKISGVIPPFVSPKVKHTWFLYVIRFEEGIDRDKAMKYLNEQGIQCKAYFPSIHLLPFYRKLFGFKEGDFPVSERVSKSTLSLPFFVQLKEDQIDIVCEKIEEAISHASK